MCIEQVKIIQTKQSNKLLWLIRFHHHPQNHCQNHQEGSHQLEIKAEAMKNTFHVLSSHKSTIMTLAFKILLSIQRAIILSNRFIEFNANLFHHTHSFQQKYPITKLQNRWILILSNPSHCSSSSSRKNFTTIIDVNALDRVLCVFVFFDHFLGAWRNSWKKQILFSFLRFFVVWKLCTCSFSCCTLRRSSHISSLCWHPLIHHPLPMKRDSRQSYDRSTGNQFKIHDRRSRWSFQTVLHNIPIILIRHQVHTPIRWNITLKFIQCY